MLIAVIALAVALALALATIVAGQVMLRYVREQLASESALRREAQMRLLGEAERREKQHTRLTEQAAAERTRLLSDARQERHELLERIQRPQHEPYVAEPDEDAPRPWVSEDDEVEADRIARAAEIEQRLTAAARAMEVPEVA